VDRACAEFYKSSASTSSALEERIQPSESRILPRSPADYALQTFGSPVSHELQLYRLFVLFTFIVASLRTASPSGVSAVLETNHHTPYFLNLHTAMWPSTMILGRTGAGKIVPPELPHHQPAEVRASTLIFDLGGSFDVLSPHPPQSSHGSYGDG